MYNPVGPTDEYIAMMQDLEEGMGFGNISFPAWPRHKHLLVHSVVFQKCEIFFNGSMEFSS